MGAARFDLRSLDGLTVTPSHVSPDTMRISELNRACAHDFMAEVLGAVYDDDNPAFDAGRWIKDDKGRMRRAMHDFLVYADHHYQDQDPDLRKVLRRRGLRGTKLEVQRLHKGFAALGRQMPSHYRNVQFRLTLNALPTLRRGRFFGSDASRPCFLCGLGARTDHYAHIFFGECAAVRKARAMFGGIIGLDLSPEHCQADSYAASSLLVFPHSSANKNLARAICIFNGVVWTERTHHYAHFQEGHVPDQAEVIRRLSSESVYAWTVLTCPKGRKPSMGFGNATNRTAKQRAAARAYADHILGQMDPSGIKAYTDGSAIGNPGPCGAGVYYVLHPENVEQELAIDLGEGTNNLGELWAIAAAIKRIEDSATIPRNQPAYIVTDSQYSIGCLTLGWKAKNALNTALVTAIKAMLATSRRIWHISWVPGHAGVDGNEVADGAAGRGAERSRRFKGDRNLHRRILDKNFY